MKKLKLYGEKKGFLGIRRKGFVAEVFVDNDGKVIVKSRNKKLERELLEMINERIQKNLTTLTKSVREQFFGGKEACHHVEEVKKPGDSKFLDAIRDASALWHTQTFAGYKISGILSKFVEE